MKSHKKSPLKDRPLRSAGQSLEEQQGRLIEEFFLFPATIWAGVMIITLLEWHRYFFPREPAPWIFTIALLVTSAFVAMKLLKTRAKVRRLKLARDGERAVGEYLERLRDQGYKVFHDITGERFNVDHVLIGPGGVFTIETKTYSKPGKGSPELTFDGESIAIGGWEPDRNPVIQARAQTGWLRDLLKESTGRDFPVMPVIVFPGWFVKSAGRPSRPLWVLNPKALPEYLKHRDTVLSESDIHLAGYHLSRFIRAEEQRRVGYSS